jgi:hypothetical protein
MLGSQEFGPNLRGFVRPGEHVGIAAAGNYDVWDKTKNVNESLQYCRIQNIGTVKVLINLNDTGTAEKFVAILAVDTAAGAGNGGVIVIPGSWNVTKINVFNPNGATAADIAILLVTNVNNQRVIN